MQSVNALKALVLPHAIRESHNDETVQVGFHRLHFTLDAMQIRCQMSTITQMIRMVPGWHEASHAAEVAAGSPG